MGQKYFLAIDVGGTKTLFAVFDESGEMICESKIKTNHDYAKFMASIAEVINGSLSRFDFSHCCCAIPGRIDFKKGIGINFGNLPWQNVPILNDLQQLLPTTKILINNDAKLAGLSEARLLHKKYKKVLYITISTGIGGGVIIDDVIDLKYTNYEPGSVKFESDGQLLKWESFASGKALKERYGKIAADIDDPTVWQQYVKTLVPGFIAAINRVEPDVVVIGGGVGTHLEKFQAYLEVALKAEASLKSLPPLLKAQRPEEAVVYGCYEYIRQNLA